MATPELALPATAMVPATQDRGRKRDICWPRRYQSGRSGPYRSRRLSDRPTFLRTVWATLISRTFSARPSPRFASRLVVLEHAPSDARGSPCAVLAANHLRDVNIRRPRTSHWTGSTDSAGLLLTTVTRVSFQKPCFCMLCGTNKVVLSEYSVEVRLMTSTNASRQG